MSQPPKAVYDCVVFIQALISGRGPAAACIEQVKRGAVTLFMSRYVLSEIRGVALRPGLVNRYHHLTGDSVRSFLTDIERYAISIAKPPPAFAVPRDPKDEPYIDLAVAAGAAFLVTWNAKHLTYLMEKDTPEGQDFCRRFPELEILAPPSFLAKTRKV